MLVRLLLFNLMETDDVLEPLGDAERRIGRNLRRIREDLELTQQDVAKRLMEQGSRFHQTQIAKIERGERPIRVNEWIAIAEALGISPDMLMEGGPNTDDRLFAAKLHYERARQIVENLGIKLHEVGSAYEEALLNFSDIRDHYRQLVEEAGQEWEDPQYMYTHEAAEKIREMRVAKDYVEPALEVLDGERERDDYQEAPHGSERYLRDGASY